LSEEIKGERLRFVEAMKEATAINVSGILTKLLCKSILKKIYTGHVEDLKRQLKHELQGMAQEINRLYRERQDVENQIADLFAFHAKQKSGGGALVGTMRSQCFRRN
jgi:hypothetical protein